MSRGANLITDVAGIRVGNAHNARLASGVTVALFEEAAVAGICTLGGAPANRDTACLEPDATVQAVDAIVLSGGSGFGLDAAGGVQAWLRAQDRGFAVGPVRVPIVPQAIVFDLLNGGDKDWGRYPPYRELGWEACEAAAIEFALGSVGGGYGATTVDLEGGLGSASAVTPSGHTVGALVVVNAIGSAVVGEGPHFWAAPWEVGDEYGGLGMPVDAAARSGPLRWKGRAEPATTIALVATDAVLTKPQARRIAVQANDGLARALRITHALSDGDTVFAAATGRRPLGDDPVRALIEIGATAADVLARAIARGVYEATDLGLPGAAPSWRGRYGGV